MSSHLELTLGQYTLRPWQTRTHCCRHKCFPVCPRAQHLLRTQIRDTKSVSEAPFTRVRTNICTDINLHGSTLRLHGTGGTGRIFERLSVQVWDLEKAGPKLAHLTLQKFVQFRRSRVNARWNRASFCPCKYLSGPV